MGLARLFLALALGVAAVTALPSAASAQGDWTVKRDPFDRRVIGRYKAILQKNPADRDALVSHRESQRTGENRLQEARAKLVIYVKESIQQPSCNVGEAVNTFVARGNRVCAHSAAICGACY